MKSFAALFLALSILASTWSAPLSLAEEDGQFFFDLATSIRTDASRHRYLVPMPSLNIRLNQGLSSPAQLTIAIPEEMPAIFSQDMTQAEIQGSAKGKISGLTTASLSEDQKRLVLNVAADLAMSSSFLINGLQLKVFELDGNNYHFFLEYEGEEGETVELPSDATIFLNRREGGKRNDTPEPFREVNLDNGNPEILNLEWSQNPDLDFQHYDLLVRDVVTLRELVKDQIESRESTKYSVGGLEEGRTYELVLKAVDTGYLEAVYRQEFVAGQLDQTGQEEETPEEPLPETHYRYRAPEGGATTEPRTSTMGAVVPGRYQPQSEAYPAPITRQSYCSDCTAEDALEKLAERAADAMPDKVLDRNDLFEILQLEELEGVLERRTARRLKALDRRLRRKRGDGQLLNIDAVELLYYMARFERLRPQLRLVRPNLRESGDLTERRFLRQLYQLQRRGLLASEDSPILLEPYEALTQESWLEVLREFYQRLDEMGK